jgi:hypothetical protein
MLFGLSGLIDLWDLLGRNITLLYSENSIVKQLSYSKIEFTTFTSFKDIISDRSNLFRTDLIIIDLWQYNLNSVLSYKEELDALDIDYIIVCKNYHYKDTDDINIFQIIKTETGIKNIYSLKYDYSILEKISGNKYTIFDLIKSYQRDKKIDDIFEE